MFPLSSSMHPSLLLALIWHPWVPSARSVPWGTVSPWGPAAGISHCVFKHCYTSPWACLRATRSRHSPNHQNPEMQHTPRANRGLLHTLYNLSGCCCCLARWWGGCRCSLSCWWDQDKAQSCPVRPPLLSSHHIFCRNFYLFIFFFLPLVVDFVHYPVK